MEKTSNFGLGRFSAKALTGINGRLMLMLLAVLVPLMIIQAFYFYDRFQTEKAKELQHNLEAGISLMDSQGRLEYRFPPLQLSWGERQWAEMHPSIKEALQGKEGTAILPTMGYDGKSRLVAVTPIEAICWVARGGKEKGDGHAGGYGFPGAPWQPLGPDGAGRLFSGLVDLPDNFPAHEKNHGAARGHRDGRVAGSDRGGGPPEISEFAGAFNDVVNRLRKNQVRLVTVFMAIPHVLLEYDADLKPLRANAAARQATGFASLDFTRDYVVEKLNFRLLDGSRVRMKDLPTTRALRGESIAGELYAVTSAEGRERVISTYAAPLYSYGKIDGVVVLWHDIMERRGGSSPGRQVTSFPLTLRQYAGGLRLLPDGI